MTLFSLLWAEEQLKFIYKMGVILVPTYRAVGKTGQVAVLNVEECPQSEHCMSVSSAVPSSPPPPPPPLESFGLLFSTKKRGSGADWHAFLSAGDDATRV